MTKFFEAFGIYSLFNVCSRFHLTDHHLKNWNVVVRNSPRKPFAHQECAAADSDLSHNSAELDLTRTLRKLSCYECHFRESRESFQTVHITHNDTIAMCWRGLVCDALFHVICLLESSWGQGNYNWCPGTHSSLCLKMSLTYKQVLIGDLPCEYLFHVDSLNKNHKNPKTFLEDNPGNATESPG